MKPSKPVFQNVLDLGLRDVGVKNEPRRLAARFGKMSAALFALIVLSLIAVCGIVAWTGAGAWIVPAFALVLTAAVFALALRTMVKRSPPIVVKVTAEGTNQGTWLVIAHSLLVVPAALVVGKLVLLIPAVALAVITTVLVWRARGRVPELLSKVRSLLATDESVLGDGTGMARGARRQEAFRLIVATDRRLLVTASTRSTEPFVLVDVPYGRVSRFGIEWTHWGRVGVLSLTVAGADGATATHVITSIVPANLLSIARALQSHGVHEDDPEAVAEAERAWEEAQQRGDSRERLFDRAAMGTRGFDRGLWLLLGLSAATFYLNPFGVGFGVSRDAIPLLLIVPAVCAICGYVSGTRSSLAYIAPLNLLVAPAFFFVDPTEVIAVMFVMSALAAVGLLAGSALRRAAASPEPRAARGGLRSQLSGLRLVRISGVMLATTLALVVAVGAAGFELTSLTVDEASAKPVPLDGRSNLTGNAASLTYTPAPGLHEFITDEHWDAGPNDGARWELRSSASKGFNVVSLAHYIFDPPLDDEAVVREFVADKDREHTRGAGFRVNHTERVVDGRRGYVWNYGKSGRYWYYGAWFPQPVHSIRVECVARRQPDRFKRLCAEAVRSLKFH